MADRSQPCGCDEALKLREENAALMEALDAAYAYLDCINSELVKERRLRITLSEFVDGREAEMNDKSVSETVLRVYQVRPTLFRAVVHVPWSWKRWIGVYGSETDAGPWVEGHGASATVAIEKLERNLGRLILNNGARCQQEAS